MLTQTAEHALRALLYLGRMPAGQRTSVLAIARETGIPAAYLAKLLHTMAARGYVRSMRGRTGGFALALPVDRIQVGDVLEMFAAPDNSRLCLLGARPCDGAHPCATHQRWSRAKEEAAAAVGRLRLSELLEGAPAIGAELEVIAGNGNGNGNGNHRTTTSPVTLEAWT